MTGMKEEGMAIVFSPNIGKIEYIIIILIEIDQKMQI